MIELMKNWEIKTRLWSCVCDYSFLFHWFHWSSFKIIVFDARLYKNFSFLRWPWQYILFSFSGKTVIGPSINWLAKSIPSSGSRCFGVSFEIATWANFGSSLSFKDRLKKLQLNNFYVCLQNPQQKVCLRSLLL